MTKKSETKKNKKQAKKSESKKTVDTSFKEAFMADAKNTTFTEETVKKLEEEVKVEPTDNETVEETNEVEVVNATEEQEDTTLDITDSEHEHWDIYATGRENEEPVEEEAVTEAEPTEEVLQVPFVQIVGEETPDTETVGESVSYTQTEVEEEPQPKKEEIKPKKKRSTSKEVYGYHWMGLIYDE